MKGSAKVNGPTVVAALVATAGAAVAITLFIRKKMTDRSCAVVASCDRAIDELERQMLSTHPEPCPA